MLKCGSAVGFVQGFSRIKKMNQATVNLIQKIVLEIALMTIKGESDIREKMLQKYGEFGFELVEEFIKSKE
jgi:hypothetical protein